MRAQSPTLAFPPLSPERAPMMVPSGSRRVPSSAPVPGPMMAPGVDAVCGASAIPTSSGSRSR